MTSLAEVCAGAARPSWSHVGGFLALAALVGCSPPPVCCATSVTKGRGDFPQSAIVPNFSLIGQEASNWCWAASAQMVMKALGREVSQCEQANRRDGGPTNCSCEGCRANFVMSADCNRVGMPDFDEFDFDARKKEAALSWDELRREILAQRPVAFSWHWRDQLSGPGHMMVAYGYEEIGQRKWVRIANPLSAERCQAEARLITYEEYRDGPNHKHFVDYSEIRRKGQP